MIREDRDRDIGTPTGTFTVPSNPNQSRRVVVYPGTLPAIGPKPPTKEAIAKAQFKDKTYRWNGR